MALEANITNGISISYETFITDNHSLIFPEGTSLNGIKFVRENANLKINFGDSNFTLTDFDFENAKDNLNNIFVVGQPDESTPLKTITVDYRIYINLSDEQIYDASLASSYKQLITGIGTVNNATENTIVYMGNHYDNIATCVGNDITFTNGNDVKMTIKGFFNNDGLLTYCGRLCLDDGNGGYETVALNDITLNVSGRTNFSNVIEIENVKYNIFEKVNFQGTDGNDTYIAGNGNDIINSGAGNDKIYINGAGIKIINSGSSNIDGDDYILQTGSARFVSYNGNDKIHFATFDFSKIEFVRGEDENENDLLIKSRVKNDDDVIVICDYFSKPENERISSFNVQGVEYTLQWKESNVVNPSGMYNIITNENPNFVDGIRNWISGENGGNGVEIKGRDEFDMLAGTSQNDTITAGIAGGELYGKAGNDKLYSGDGFDYIVGGSGDDEIYLGNTALDDDSVLFIDPDGATPEGMLAFGKDTVYNANLFDNLRFVYNTGANYIGYRPSDLTFEKSGTSLLIKAGENEVKLVNYFDKRGKVQKTAPYRITLLNGNNEPSDYFIEALRASKKLDYSQQYEFDELTFVRDITGNSANDLVIKKGDEVVETLTNFFKQKNPVDLVLLKDDTISIKNEAEIQVITGNKNYTGTGYNETVTSSSANETYNLKSNYDEILFSGAFGQDTVVPNDNQNLTLIFNKDNVSWSISGKDVILKDGENNQVTIKNYVAKEYKNTDIYIKTNSYEYKKNLKYFNFEPQVKENKVTGTRLNEIYLSTKENEIVNLKTGEDTVLYDVQEDTNGNLIGWGNDRIIVNKNEELEVDIVDKHVVTKDAIPYTYEVQNNLEVKGKDLIITSIAVCDNPPEGYDRKYNLGTITLIGGANIDSSTTIWLNDENLSSSYIDYQTGEITAALSYNENDVSKKGTINGTQLSDYVNLTNYMSEKGKGVNINTKGGEDIVMGSKYNDTIKSMSGSNRIEEYAGNNIITTGSGDDEIVAGGTSSNTIEAGNGRNWVWLDSSGDNKLTAGNGNNYITVTNGNNTIKAGNGVSLVKLQGGKNTVITGKERDDIIVSDPYLTGVQSINVIKTGTGADTIQIDAMSENTINAGDGGKNQYGENIGNKIIINNGINTVTSGKNADKITVTGGQNIIDSGAGDDNFTISGGTSIVNGDKGNDIYNVDITSFNNSLIINDTKGTNILNLGAANNNQVNIFFDVALSKKGKAVFGEMKFSTDNVVGADGFDNLNGVDVANKNVISKLEYGEAGTYKSFTITSTEIDKLAADIANWLKSKPNYSSTADVYSSGNAADIAKLTSAYTNFANDGYIYKNTHSLMN